MPEFKDELLDHDYHGIREYDNDLPRWWQWLFYLSILFALGYLIHYHVLGSGDLQDVEYRKELDPAYVKRTGALKAYHSPFHTVGKEWTPRLRAAQDEAAALAFQTHLIKAMAQADAGQLAKLKEDFPDIYDAFMAGGGTAARVSRPARAKIEVPTGLASLDSEADLAAGSAVFNSQCVTCHGALGEGGIGPNLTDEYWIHGGTLDDVVRTIYVGVPAKGMIPWFGTLDQQEIHQVASYILQSLQGTNPPNAKAPQGEKAR